MSSSNRRIVLKTGLAFLGGVGLSACGFAPLYAPGGAARALRGKIRVIVPESRMGYVMRERLHRRLGNPDADAPYLLTTSLSFSKQGLAISRDNQITRYNIVARSVYNLAEMGADKDARLLQGEVTSTTGFSATATAYAARVAERAAEERLAEDLAEKIANRIHLNAESVSA